MKFTLCRSKNNTRCERVWYDMSLGVGHGWKDFFIVLEEEYELDVDNQSHIWLLHFIFLPAINSDLEEWTAMWNCHKLRIEDERNRSPEDMFHFGFVEYGLTGQEDILRRRSGASADLDIDSDDEDPEDWIYEPSVEQDGESELDNGLAQDAADFPPLNPFVTTNLPRSLSRITCAAPFCPLNDEQLLSLVDFVAPRAGAGMESKATMARLWVQCLGFCRRQLQFA
ncbi:hypothetical protein SCHPADRAFT_836410 [Schizopora paradoxa]|uniref:Integrase core domain-containing protein n=1 Tax=Schizopora paradoxa TaxID=27342 RepID=A0A0H2R719_9AGAM|nr:hypothetical protein SCHPADRAFT_836410 [Schizopora paradoxa]